jgi:hypothetical protein
MGVNQMKKLLLAILAIMVLSIALVSAADFSIVSLNTGSGNLGDAISYTLEVQNDDLVETLTFTCTSTDLTDGTYTITAPSISDITSVAPLTTGTSAFDVTIPSQSVAAGLYTSTITCTESLDQTTQQTTLELTVNSEDAFSTDSSLDVEVAVDDNDDFSITVTNIGSSDLDFTATYESEDGDIGYIEDNDGDQILITFTSLPTTVTPGSSETITMNVDVEDGVDFGEDYEGIITITAGTATADVALDVNLEAEICDEGLQGNKLSISIDEPDTGDDFKPGDTVNVEFDVENDDNDDIDVEVQLVLWDSTEGEEVDTYDVDDLNIDDDDEESFDIDYELPTDLDEDHVYYLYVKANEDGDEDDECTYERVRLDIELDDDDVVITSTEVSPSSLECGDEIVLTVEVESIGTDEQEDVYIEVEDADLEIDASTDYFDLGDHNDNDNDYQATFTFDLPEDLDADTYYVDVKVYDGSGDLYDSELVGITLGTCGSSSSNDDDDDTIPDEDLVEGVELELILDNDFDVEGLDKLTIPVIIQNKGEEDTTLSLTVDDISWADVEGTEYLSNIQSGQSLHAYVYLDLETDVTGVHDLVIEVEDGNGVSTSEIIELDFGEGNEITGNATGIGDWNSEVWYWIIGIVLLVVILIILIRVLTR